MHILSNKTHIIHTCLKTRETKRTGSKGIIAHAASRGVIFPAEISLFLTIDINDVHVRADIPEILGYRQY